MVPQPEMAISFGSASDFLASRLVHMIDEVKSAVLTFAEDTPAGTLLPLVCVFKGVQS